MSIAKQYLHLYREVFAFPGVLADPFLVFGYQDMPKAGLPEDFNFGDVKAFLRAKGLNDIHIMDLFDDRADLRYDLNLPAPPYEYERYQTLLDIGSIEHLFDTRQCLENCLRMVKVGGWYIVHTNINGYFGHGFHVFNPALLLEALALNQFDIVYKKYCTFKGRLVKDPSIRKDVLILIAARKRASIDRFVIPQQGFWDMMYKGLPYSWEFEDRLESRTLRGQGKKLIMKIFGPRQGQRVAAFLRKILQRISVKRAAHSTHD